ncbi:TPA: citrate transporter [Streptococcus equi subsp. zooepidemicus]|nr:citrate transporter [Streptococcus equi subsp. zooepidemicus]
MLLTVLAYAMIIIFMYVVMKKKMTPFTALVMIPLIMTIAVILTGSADFTSDAKFVAFVGEDGLAKNLTAIGPMIMYGINNTAKTGIMLLFAILFFSIMLDAGLFDPITEKMIRFAKGDPMKVLMATAIVAAAVSLNGDGTTTTLICCSAFLPIYKKLNMRIMNLGVLIILQNTIMNLLPWGGPTARAMSVLSVGPEILGYLAPGMVLSLLYVICWVAPSMGRKERARLGVVDLTEEEMRKLTDITDPDTLSIRRPKNFAFNAILTIGLITWLVAGSFYKAIAMAPLLLFAVGTCIALISAPGTFFISNDGFYYGILPVLAEAGAEYGFSNMAMALASLMGQAFHLLSPLVAFIYLLLRLTGLDMGEWQKEAAKYAIIIFIIFVVTIIAMGQMPLYIPQ